MYLIVRLWAALWFLHALNEKKTVIDSYLSTLSANNKLNIFCYVYLPSMGPGWVMFSYDSSNLSSLETPLMFSSHKTSSSIPSGVFEIDQLLKAHLITSCVMVCQKLSIHTHTHTCSHWGLCCHYPKYGPSLFMCLGARTSQALGCTIRLPCLTMRSSIHCVGDAPYICCRVPMWDIFNQNTS